MTAEFGQSGRQIRQDRDERLDRDRLRQREAPRRLPVEAATILDAGAEAPQWDVEPAGELDGGRPDRLVLMDMLVRVEVGGIATDPSAKVVQLTLQFLCDNRVIIERNNPIDEDPGLAVVIPFTEIEVEAMARHGLINQPHFLESPFQPEDQQSKFAWYRDAGALGPDLVFGHFIQTTDEIIAAMHDLHDAGCDLLTLTQYLRPTPRHHPVDRWVHPDEFVALQQQAEDIGFAGVLAGPLVRSSYRAGRLYRQAREGRVGLLTRGE